MAAVEGPVAWNRNPTNTFIRYSRSDLHIRSDSTAAGQNTNSNDRGYYCSALRTKLHSSDSSSSESLRSSAPSILPSFPTWPPPARLDRVPAPTGCHTGRRDWGRNCAEGGHKTRSDKVPEGLLSWRTGWKDERNTREKEEIKRTQKLEDRGDELWKAEGWGRCEATGRGRWRRDTWRRSREVRNFDSNWRNTEDRQERKEEEKLKGGKEGQSQYQQQFEAAATAIEASLPFSSHQPADWRRNQQTRVECREGRYQGKNDPQQQRASNESNKKHLLIGDEPLTREESVKEEEVHCNESKHPKNERSVRDWVSSVRAGYAQRDDEEEEQETGEGGSEASGWSVDYSELDGFELPPLAVSLEDQEILQFGEPATAKTEADRAMDADEAEEERRRQTSTVKGESTQRRGDQNSNNTGIIVACNRSGLCGYDGDSSLDEDEENPSQREVITATTRATAGKRKEEDEGASLVEEGSVWCKFSEQSSGSMESCGLLLEEWRSSVLSAIQRGGTSSWQQHGGGWDPKFPPASTTFIDEAISSSTAKEREASQTSEWARKERETTEGGSTHSSVEHLIPSHDGIVKTEKTAAPFNTSKEHIHQTDESSSKSSSSLTVAAEVSSITPPPLHAPFSCTTFPSSDFSDGFGVSSCCLAGCCCSAKVGLRSSSPPCLSGCQASSWCYSSCFLPEHYHSSQQAAWEGVAAPMVRLKEEPRGWQLCGSLSSDTVDSPIGDSSLFDSSSPSHSFSASPPFSHLHFLADDSNISSPTSQQQQQCFAQQPCLPPFYPAAWLRPAPPFSLSPGHAMRGGMVGMQGGGGVFSSRCSGFCPPYSQLSAWQQPGCSASSLYYSNFAYPATASWCLVPVSR